LKLRVDSRNGTIRRPGFARSHCHSALPAVTIISVLGFPGFQPFLSGMRLAASHSLPVEVRGCGRYL